VRLSDVQPTSLRWLWPGRIPLARTSELIGKGGVAKSTILADIAARVTRGWEMPGAGLGDLHATPRGGVILSAEDGVGETLRPRLECAGADANRVNILPPDILLTDLASIQTAIEEVKPALVIVDPVTAFMPERAMIDPHHHAVLGPFAQLVEAASAAAIWIRHLNAKGTRGAGSSAYRNLARNALLATEDPEDRAWFILAHEKCNLAQLAPAVRYRLEGEGTEVRVEWGSEVAYSAEELLSQPATSKRPAPQRERAATFLRARLANGPVLVNVLKDSAAAEDLPWRTVERAAKDLGVEPKKTGWSRDPWH
jgi:RecA-family ATPase